MNYKRPIALTERTVTRRIFSPLAYEVVRAAWYCPIVASEAMKQAAHCPVVWKKMNGGLALVAIRAFHHLPAAYLANSAGYAALPLLCQAYPFLWLPDGQKGLDDVNADRPTDLGSPIVAADHKLTKATTMRFAALQVYERARMATQDLTSQAAELDLFMPWQLPLQGPGLDELLVLKTDIWESTKFQKLVVRFGSEAAELVALHRMSLFKAGPLLEAAAKAANIKGP